MVTTAAQIKTAGRAAMLAGVVLAASEARACEVAIDRVNDPVKVLADGSFANVDLGAGPQQWDRLSGAVPLDLGSGKVAQTVILPNASCSSDEVLVVSDCGGGEAIALWGRVDPSITDPDAGYGRGDEVASLLEPLGPLRLDGTVTVAGLADTAEAGRIRFVVKGKEQGQWAPWKAYPMHRACKLFYPGSPGAK